MAKENHKENTMVEQVQTNMKKEHIIELIKLAANYDGCASKMVAKNETTASKEEKQQITKELCHFLTDGLIEILCNDQTKISQKFFLFLLMGSPDQIAYNLFISTKVRDLYDNTDKTDEKQSVINRSPKYIEVFRGVKYVDLETILDWMSLVKNVLNKDDVFFDGEECSNKTKEDFFDWLKNLIYLKTKYLFLKNKDSAESLTDEEMYLLQDAEQSNTYDDIYDIFYYSASFFKNKEQENQFKINTNE